MLHRGVGKYCKISRGVFFLVATSLCLSGCGKPHKNIPLPAYLQAIPLPDQRFQHYTSSFRAERQRIDPRKRKFLQYSGALKSLSKTEVGLALSGGGIRSASFQLGLMSGLHKHNILRGIDYLSAVSGGSWAAGAYKSARVEDAEFFKQLDVSVENERSKLCDDSLRKMNQNAISESYQVCNAAGARILLSSYRETLKGLKKSLNLLDPLDKDIGYVFRETWRTMIQESFLQGVGNDIPLHLVEDAQDEMTKSHSLFQAGAQYRAGRPYLIINGTHSEGTWSQPQKNFPFQFTADAIGTIADCGNTDYCPAPDLRSRDKNYQGIFLHLDKKAKEHPLSTLYLSHAMAISGAVAPANLLGIDLGIMEWHIQFPFPEQQLTDIEDVPYRKEYVVADGGHSDNFGVLALLERNIGLLIISDAAFDVEERFEDFAVLKQHANALLKQDIVLKAKGEGLHELHWITGGETIETPPLREVFKGRDTDDFFRDALYDIDSRLRFNGQFFSVDHYEEPDKNLNVLLAGKPYSDLCGEKNLPCKEKRKKEFEDHTKRYHGEGYREKENGDPITLGYFTRHAGTPGSWSKDNHADLGRLIYVKPPKDLTEFLRYLRENENFHIYNYLLLNKGQFPCDKTFAVSYHNELIQAYYLLGKFIGEKYLGHSIARELAAWPEQDIRGKADSRISNED